MSRHILLALVAAASTLGGCAWLMGYDQLPQPSAPFRVARATLTTHVDDLGADARFLGPGERIATDHTVLGRVARAVNPYGEDSLVFDLTLTNAGSVPAAVLPSQAQLAADGAKAMPARTLDEFRRRWPTWAVEGPEQTTDRAAAMGFVMDTLLLDRQVMPNASARGRLAFALQRPVRKLSLTVPVRVGEHNSALAFTWEVF